jgi:hypothetical protein
MDEEAGAIEGDPLRSGRRGPSPRVYRERGERFERGRAGGGRRKGKKKRGLVFESGCGDLGP